MAAPKPILVADLRGGRNGADPPLSLPDNQCVEALNVDWLDGLIGRKRGGSDAIAETGGTAFSSGIQSLARFVPGTDETAAELWAVDGAATPIVKRMAGGTAYANVTLDDAIATSPQSVVAATLNGKLYLAYDSAVDRLHCYDRGLSAPRVRRVGIDPGASAPTVANTGAGAYGAVLRYYRVRFASPNLIRYSEPTPSVSFTPSGTGTAARITRPTAPGEGETHWIVEISVDNASWVRSPAFVVLATTTYDDSAVPATSVQTGVPSEAIGAFGLVPSVKYLITDGNRLLGAGAWESAGATSGGKGSRVWFTPVLGSLGEGDDERVPNQTNQKNWIDLNENDGGGITGLATLEGVPYAFKYRQVYRLTPTGDLGVPYLARRRSTRFGCLAHKAIVEAKDSAGQAALYFLSPDGPYRLTAAGLQYLGRDIEDIWATVNLGASSVVAHGVFYHDIHQVWWWIATGANNDPDTRIVFDTLLGRFVEGERVRGGWAKHTGSAAGARCSVMFSNTLGAAMSRDLKPYFGRSTGTVIWKGNTATTDDAGTAFQAYVKTKPLQAAPLGQNIGIGPTQLLAKATAGVTITQTIDRDYGFETSAATVLLTASGSETRVLRKIEGSQMSAAGTIQIQLGDGAAVASAWTLDALMVPVGAQEVR